MNIKPLADRVLVLPAPAEEKVGGIIIPDTAKEKPLHGKIVATATGPRTRKWCSRRATRFSTASIREQNSSLKV